MADECSKFYDRRFNLNTSSAYMMQHPDGQRNSQGASQPNVNPRSTKFCVVSVRSYRCPSSGFGNLLRHASRKVVFTDASTEVTEGFAFVSFGFVQGQNG